MSGPIPAAVRELLASGITPRDVAELLRADERAIALIASQPDADPTASIREASEQPKSQHG